VIVANQPPKFDNGTTTFNALYVPLNSTYIMTIPSYSDPENTTHSIRFEQTSIPNVAANLTGLNQLTISPKSFNEIGAHQTYIVLFDQFSEVKYSLSIVVTNTAPQFNSSSFNFSSTMQVNQTQINYFNFTYYDAENNSVAVAA
jgi:hypothetical protein